MEIQDSIQYANELGRLDFLSAMLATLGIMLVVLSFPIYFHLRGRAESAAKEAIEEQSKELHIKLEKIAVEKMEQLLPELIKDYKALVSNETEMGLADRVAQSQEDDGNG